ncbi:universal stress protein UspE [Thalassovita gelatinovora]|uniref:Universal stress protein UspE n=1 Tax=Thalassovita gelatinovora TaxID=53501 RepID=A0A0P1G2B0_THAGE|nr:universal stress protein [Thalassovita gelatinovora]QIZ79813.1 universal stress protein [Thalassovita gelatinovora]CUH66871.1 universal stress protein UspE [Thalassovita gelatinovora]SEQ44231.1 Nucleotide-binding universal stress protein, UspA family [Thalassovita gelatinovora]
MINTIIAATDLSHRGDLAVRRGFAVARALKARLIVLSIVDDALPLPIIADITQNAQKSLGAFAQTLGDGVKYEIRVERGDPTGDIVASVEREGADLLVMGPHRDRSFFDLVRETTAQRITRLAKVPVLMAADRDERPYETIVLGADFSPNATAGAGLAAQLAPGARILPVHTIQVPYRGMLAQSGNADELLRSFSKEPIQNDRQWRDSTDLPDTLADTVIIEGGAASALADVARREDAHLIVVGAHGRVGQHRAFLGSVASDMMRNPPCDVLIVRQQGT